MSKNLTQTIATLNPEQRDVVEHVRGPILVGAVAGAGKTTALVARIANLVETHDVDPRRILAVTFSAKAAGEMNERLRGMIGETDARVGTFHSLANQIVREEKLAPGYRLDERDRYRTIIKDVLGFRGMRWDSADLTTVSAYIGRAKASCALPGTPAALEVARKFYAVNPCAQRSPELLADAYARAEVARRDSMLITFDDMLLDAWHAMNSDESTRARWASRWDFVMQDECQDENLVQREIASMLARDHRNYMVVGDPAQAIYGFRGSDPSGLLAFAGAWSAKVVHMHRNYRCGDAIAAAANGVLGAMAPAAKLDMSITAERGVAGDVLATRFVDMDAEATGVVAEILARGTDGAKWSSMAALYRTNAQSRALEEALLSNRIPYVVIGGTNFYDRKEIKDLLGYLRIASGRGEFDDVRRCINAPFRFLGKAFVEKVDSMHVDAQTWPETVRRTSATAGLQSRQRTSALEWCALVDTLTKRIAAGGDDAKPAALIEEVLAETDFVRWITRDEGTESPENSRVSNIRELVRASERFVTVDDLLDYVDEQIEASKRAKVGQDSNRVTLMSIHRSKGLEWPTVFVIGANEKILPHARCEDVEEERRLAYVAFTRARDTLRVSCVANAAIGPKVVALAPSRFVVEAGLAVVNASCVAKDAAE